MPAHPGWIRFAVPLLATAAGLAACAPASVPDRQPALAGSAATGSGPGSRGNRPLQQADATLGGLEQQLNAVQAQILRAQPYRTLARSASLAGAKSALVQEIAASHLGVAGCPAADRQEGVVLTELDAAASGLAAMTRQTGQLQAEFSRAQQLSAQLAAAAGTLERLLRTYPAAAAQVDGDLLAAQLGATHHEQVLAAGVVRAVAQVQAEPTKARRLATRARYLGTACHQVPTSLTLTSSDPTAVVSQSGQLVATVGVPAGARAATAGSITFAAGGRSLASVAIGPAGTARLTLSALLFGNAGLGAGGVGVLDVTATYSGDAYHAPSSATLSQGLAAIPTAVQGTEMITSPTTASGIRILATVENAAAVPARPQGGTVTLWRAGSPLTSAAVGPASRAVLAVRPIAAGSNLLTVVYSGDAYHAPTSYSFTAVVRP